MGIDFSPEVGNKAKKMELFKRMQATPEFLSALPNKGVYDGDKQFFAHSTLGAARQVRG